MYYKACHMNDPNQAQILQDEVEHEEDLQSKLEDLEVILERGMRA